MQRINARPLQGIQPALVGLVLGTLAALGTNQLLATQLVEISPWDPIALIAAALLILVATLLGCFVPALQATRVDPLQAMRGD